jgi:hypothetical protein
MSFCNTVRAKVKAILRQFDQYIQDHVETALKVTPALKNFLASPAGDVLTAIIPTDIDSVIRSKILIALNEVIPALTIINDCKKSPHLDDKMRCFIQQFKTMDPDMRDAVLQKFAALLTRELHGCKLAQNVYDLFVQASYSIKK